MKSAAGSDNGTDTTECTRDPREGNHTGGCTGTIRGAAPLTTDAHSSTEPNSANDTFMANKTFMNVTFGMPAVRSTDPVTGS